jgi:hypothetical protein
MFSVVSVHTNSSLNLTVKTNKQMYDDGNTVQVSGSLTMNGIPTTDGLVGLEVDTSTGTLVARTLAATQPPSATPFVYTTYVAPCDANDNPTFTFARNTNAYFKVNVENLNYFYSYPVLVTVNVYDNTSTPLGVEDLGKTVLPNSSYLLTISFPIPSDATLGTATVYANAYSNWPSLGGTPYVREVNATFQIVDDASGSGQTAQSQSPKPQSTGTTNYGTTFRINLNAAPDDYSAYVSSSYDGQTASNLTTFTISGGLPLKWVLGDLGCAVPVPPFYEFGKFDGEVSSDDTTMFILCLRGEAPAQYMHLGDLGRDITTPPYYQFFNYDGKVNSADTTMFILCLRGKGPTGPVAIFTLSPTTPIINQPVTFNATQSHDDKYGTITSYKWTFGDGNVTTITSPIVIHKFTSSGNYTVTLLVTDNESQYDSTSYVIRL